MKRILSLLFLAFAGAVWALGTTAGGYRIDLVSDPPVVPIGRATITLRVTNPSGQPVTGAQIKVIAQMPGMPMGEREEFSTPGEQPGTYRVPATFAMAGKYEARISITGPLGSAAATVPLETGQSTIATDRDSFPWSTAISLALGAVFAFFVLYRMRRTGQRVDVRPIFTRPVIVSLVLFGIVVWGAVYVVNHFRRPGAMTPVQAQVMRMDAPAPEGVVPVTLASAQEMPFEPTVRYSGQAVGFVEQDVYPRVTGAIVWMPFYVGDSVHKGQVLARLDTTQTLPEVIDKDAALRSARSGVDTAKAEYRQAVAGVGEAEAEHGQHQAMVEEMESNVAAAQRGGDAARSQVLAAESDVAIAKAKVSSALADEVYWSDELKRERSLFASGAVSKDEFEKEKAEADQRAAALRGANREVAGAQAKLQAARSQRRQADAAVASAQKRLKEAQSELSAHHAHVQMAEATAASAKSKINQALAAVGAAKAQLQAAAANESYAEIRAETDGVITRRLISPGVLVSPGQAILRVAQIRPIRVQANVAESDLARVHVGAVVQVRHGDADEKAVLARVTSVSPALDPYSRTGVVEAVLANPEKAFLPGQFVTMDIAISAGRKALVVPMSAVQTDVQPSETDVISTHQEHFVWVATPLAGQDGRFTINQARVEVGDSSGDLVAIQGGLRPGQQVVTSGSEYLLAGQVVEATLANASVPAAAPTVEITEQGFVPPSTRVAAGPGAAVTFIRRTDNTCAKEVVFPELKVRKPLPLNVPVKIELPTGFKGELDYVCGMNMLHGKLVVK